MPIFEFRCVSCGKVFEKLIRDRDQEVEIKCPECGSEEADRVISRSNSIVRGSKGNKTKLTSKSCSPGSSCHTLEIPGAGD